MDNAKVAEFSAHYKNLGEWDLFDIDKSRATLVEEARIALDQTLSKRAIDLSKLKEAEAAEFFQQAKHERLKKIKAEKRNARHFKFFLFVGIPIIIAGALFRTEQFYETLVSSLTQVGLICLIYWGYLRFKRTRNRREP